MVRSPSQDRDVAVDRGTVGVVRRVPLEQLGHEFELAAGRLQALAELLGVLRRQRSGSGRSFGRPSANQRMSTGWRSSGFSGGDDVVALAAEVCPGDVVRQIRGIENPLDPVELAAALGEHRAQAEPGEDGGEDVVVRTRFAQAARCTCAAA